MVLSVYIANGIAVCGGITHFWEQADEQIIGIWSERSWEEETVGNCDHVHSLYIEEHEMGRPYKNLPLKKRWKELLENIKFKTKRKN
jgi:hypothetical protein